MALEFFMAHEKKSSFSGSIGFVLASAGSAVGLGNIWRFPYLAAQGGGGIFLLTYIILALTFGFTLLTTEVALGRKMRKSPIEAFGAISKKWKWVGYLAFVIPAIIITYYTVIGGWVLKYLVTYITGKGAEAAESSFFSSFISSPFESSIYMLIYFFLTSFVVYKGVEKGIEKSSSIIMPALFVLIMIVAVYSLTLKYDGRTGVEGFIHYVVPSFEGMTLKRYLEILISAMGQLFYSLSVAMGIMITYGSYVKDDVNLEKSLGQIEFFDSMVAFLAGMMIIPAVYVFFGMDGMSAGPGLIFVSLPKIFLSMGLIGQIIGVLFFVMVLFAALTSSISILETLVANAIEVFSVERKKACLSISLIAAVVAVVVCLGYSVFYFEVKLPTGSVGQLLDVFDYISNSVLMPVVAISTCVLVGWVLSPNWIINEVEKNGVVFKKKRLYVVMVKFVAPVLLLILFFESLGLSSLIDSIFG